MLVISVFAHIQSCIVRYQTRRCLKVFTPEQMLDTGITPEQCANEIRKSNLAVLLLEICHLSRRRIQKL